MVLWRSSNPRAAMASSCCSLDLAKLSLAAATAATARPVIAAAPVQVRWRRAGVVLGGRLGAEFREFLRRRVVVSAASNEEQAVVVSEVVRGLLLDMDNVHCDFLAIFSNFFLM